MDTNDLSSISSRNVVAVLSLIDLCLVECENIQECWEDCLYTIVKMERLHMIASGWKEEQPHIQNNASRRSRFGVLPQYPKGVSTTILTANMIPQCVLETSSLEFGKLYVSLRFSDTSVVEFFRGLCATFVLQRIVVTAESNTDKSEKVWKQIWEYLTPFYIRCGLHPNEDVSMSVLNNLRQLTTNSLKHEEKETNNQSLFLQPYVIIISDHPSLTVRQFVIQAMNQIVSNQKGCQNLKSGWSTLFEVFLFSSVDEQVSISAFQVFKQLFKIYRTSSFFEHYYFHFLRCIHSFGKTTSPEEVGIQLNSLIQHILTSTFSSNDLLEVNHEVYTKIIPLFQILSNGVLSPHMSVCTNAISVLFNVLEIFRKTVTNDMMETLLSCCVLPLFTTNTTLTWINNVSELLFQSILQFLIEEKEFQKYLIQVLKFSFYVVFHQGSSFSTHALSFINCLISKATEHENTNLLHEIVEQFCVYFDTILHYIPVLDKYTNSQRENQISSETDPKLTDVCLVCNKEVISEYLIPCPITDIFNKFFNLFDKHQTFVSTFSKSENLIEIYDLFVVQLFEMYLHLFLLDEKHRNLVISLFYSFIESVLIKFVENKYIYTLSVPKSVVLSFISQITKIQNDEAFYKISDFLYKILVDIIVTDDKEIRLIIRSILLRHRSLISVYN
ncbi:Brefeldin a-inhibited guanine nucleotide-exchange protein [Entamoeba marina]